MNEYHKIPNVYLRDAETHEITDACGTEEIAFLFENSWLWTEKIDGMNIRVTWDSFNHTVCIQGRTDRAIIPPALSARLGKLFNKIKMEEVFPNNSASVVLYGEGYGKKIQKAGSRYIPDGVDFILFDIRIGRWWLARPTVNLIAEQLGVSVVPVVGEGPLSEAIALVKSGFSSLISQEPQQAEGLVCRPNTELFGRNGCRVICKVKSRDFYQGA